MSEPDGAFVAAVKRLAEGEFEPEAWLIWWKDHAERAAAVLNAGQRQRLRPPTPGGFGPACRCAFVSQQEACALLDRWGVAYRRSDRYEREWERAFAAFVAESDAEAEARRERFREPLRRLSERYPKLGRYLQRYPEKLEDLAEPATGAEIADLERTLDRPVPEVFRRFLRLTRTLIIGDDVKLGLDYALLVTSRGSDVRALQFGEYWVESDGDGVVFAAAAPGDEPRILRYEHANGSLHRLADSFDVWIETLPRKLRG